MNRNTMGMVGWLVLVGLGGCPPEDSAQQGASSTGGPGEQTAEQGSGPDAAGEGEPGAQDASVPDPAAPLSCDERATVASQGLEATLAEHSACESDADCIWVATDTDCRGSCGSAVHRDGASAVATTIRELNAGVCQNYTADGCPFATPGCLPPAPACQQGVCVTHVDEPEPLSCEQRGLAAREAIDDALAEQPACAAASDCIWVPTGTDCAGSCGAIVHRDAEGAVRDAVAGANEGVCRGYAADGCPFATPGCLAPDPDCVEGRCVDSY